MPADSTNSRHRNPPPRCRDDSPPSSPAGRAASFSFILRVGRGDPALGSLPAHSEPGQGSPDGLPAYPLGGQSFLEAHFSSHLQGPQAAVLAELSGLLVQQLPQGLAPLRIECPMNGMRTLRASLKRLRKAPFVEGVDGVASALGVAPEASGYLVGVLAPGTSQQDLTPTEDESIRGAQPRLQSFLLGVAQRTHKDWSFHNPEDKPSTTVSSGHALGPLGGSHLLPRCKSPCSFGIYSI